MVRGVVGGGDTKGEGGTDKLYNSAFPNEIRIFLEKRVYDLLIFMSEELRDSFINKRNEWMNEWTNEKQAGVEQTKVQTVPQIKYD